MKKHMRDTLILATYLFEMEAWDDSYAVVSAYTEGKISWEERVVYHQAINTVLDQLEILRSN